MEANDGLRVDSDDVQAPTVALQQLCKQAQENSPDLLVLQPGREGEREEGTARKNPAHPPCRKPSGGGTLILPLPTLWVMPGTETEPNKAKGMLAGKGIVKGSVLPTPVGFS